MRTLTREVMELLGAGTRRRWVGLVVLAVIVSIVDAAGAGLVYTLLKIVTQEGARVELPLIGDVRERFSSLDERELVRLAVAVVGAFFAARGVLYLAQSYLQNRIAYNTGVALSGRLLRGYLAGTYTDHLRRSTATSIRNAHESVQLLVQQVLVPGVGLISEGMLILVVFLVMLVIAPIPTALTIVVLVPLAALLVRGLQPRLVRYGETSQEMSTASLHALTQTLGGFREIKMHGREGFFERRFSVSRAALARAFYLRSFLLDVPRVGVETGLVLFILVFIAVTVGEDGAEDSTITILGFFGYAGLRVLPSLNRIMVNLQQIRFGTPLIGELFEDVTAADAAVVAAAAAGPVVPMAFEQAVSLRGVSVRYENADRMALVDVDLELRRGEWLGVVGPTGGGKSTLVDVVTGFLPPTTGRVLVDGIDIWPDPRGWRERIGIVPQAVFLVDDSIRRNVALGFEEGEIDDERVAEALRLARLDGWVEQLPEGVHAQVGERGVKVSGGQRQRIAIARALYHRPDVVVFDEGTSALDRATESEVIDALQQLRGGRTLVTVAHRLSTIRSCDRIAVVDEGRVVATGSYDELASSSEAFRALNP